MAIVFADVALPKVSRTVESKYPFGQLVAGGQPLIENEVVDPHKVKSRMSSALVAFKKRTGDNGKYSVRVFKQEDGTDAVGVWKLVK